jgi:hypothetical protein
LHLSIVACLVSFPPHFRRLLLTELRNAQQQGRLRLVGALESLHSMYKSVRALHLHQRETAARLAASAAGAVAGGVLEGTVSLSLAHNNGTGNDAGSSVPQLTHNTASFSSYTSGSGSSTSTSGTTTTNNNSNFNHNSNSNSNPAQGTSASGSSSSSVQPRKYTKDDLVLKQFLVHGHARHISASKSAAETVGKLIHSVEVESSYNDILRAHPEFAGMSKMMLRQPGYSDWQWPFLLNRYVAVSMSQMCFLFRSAVRQVF